MSFTRRAVQANAACRVDRRGVPCRPMLRKQYKEKISDYRNWEQLEHAEELRIRYRWEVLDAENKAIREHCARRRAVHTGAEKDLIGEWEPERMENGETKPQIAPAASVPRGFPSRCLPAARVSPRQKIG